jgi:hypothetical protein
MVMNLIDTILGFAGGMFGMWFIATDWRDRYQWTKPREGETDGQLGRRIRGMHDR